MSDKAKPNFAQPTHQPSPVAFVVALLVGLAMMAFGARAALAHAGDSHPVALAVHIVGFDLAHDAVFAPLLLAVGIIVRRLVPRRMRAMVGLALSLSLLVVAFSYPMVRRWGRRPGNSSTLPLAYGRNVMVLFALIWLVTLTVALVRRRRK